MNEKQRKEWIQAAKEQVLRNARETDQCERNLMELYSECAVQLEKEIRAFYSKYASDNQLTETEPPDCFPAKNTALLNGP